MRVLVTGGAGMIGSHVAEELLRGGHEVTVLDNLEPQVHRNGAPSWITAETRFLHGDVRDPAALDRALEGCQAVVHLAAYGGFSPEFSKIAEVNCTGTARLFEAIRRSGNVRKVVTASSMAVYGEGWYRCERHGAFHGRPRERERLERGDWSMGCPSCGASAQAERIPESSDALPASPYACSKFFQERLTLAEGSVLGIAAVALRYFLTFGPRQSVTNAYSGICSIFSTRLLNGLSPILYEDGQQLRDVVYVEDAARATRLVLERHEADGCVFNVARGEGVTIAEFARAVAAAHGLFLEPESGRRYRPLDNRHMLGDPSALQALGWKPQVDLREGLRRYVEWVRGLGDVAEYFSGVERELRRVGLVRTVRT